MGNRCFKPQQSINGDLDFSEHGFPGGETKAVEGLSPGGNTSPSFFNFSLTAPGGVAGGDDAFWDGESTRNCQENTRMFVNIPPSSETNTPQSRGKSVSFQDNADTDYAGAGEHDLPSHQTPRRQMLSSSEIPSTPYSIGKGTHGLSAPPDAQPNKHGEGDGTSSDGGVHQGGSEWLDYQEVGSSIDQRGATDANDIEYFDTSEGFMSRAGNEDVLVISTSERAETHEHEQRGVEIQCASTGTGTLQNTSGQPSSTMEMSRDSHVKNQFLSFAAPDVLTFEMPSAAAVVSKTVPLHTE